MLQPVPRNDPLPRAVHYANLDYALPGVVETKGCEAARGRDGQFAVLVVVGVPHGWRKIKEYTILRDVQDISCKTLATVLTEAKR